MTEEKGIKFNLEELPDALRSSNHEIIYPYVNRLIKQAETILDIDPSLSEDEIFQIVTKTVVDFLSAEFANIGVFDRGWKHLTSSGHQASLPEGDKRAMPFEDSIAEEVVRRRQGYCIPNILKEERWKDKETFIKSGIYSMMVFPFAIPRFSARESDPEGILQIFYKEQDKLFTELEIEIAEMFSRQVSYVLARKRIKDLQRFHAIKDKIVEHIFVRLARGEGIRMKDLFNSVIPELSEIIEIQRCSLFSIKRDRREILLEAGYPPTAHGIGKIRSTEEPYVNVMINQAGPFGDFESEKIYPQYVLITNPQKSHLLPMDIKHFLQTQQIHSVLYLPLKVEETVNYFLAFDAQAQHERFSEEEIEILVFLGMELMKGLRLERMDDLLHDFKNPAIALFGFAKRIQRILGEEKYPKNEKLNQALEIILKECARLQDLSLTLHGDGKETTVDLTELLKKRFLINQEAIKELKRDNIQLVQQELISPLWIRCFALHIERIFDNLLLNASTAIPEEGGELSIRTYQKDLWAVAEITNTGQMSEDEREAYLHGETKGRGLDIMTRLIQQMGGMIWMDSKEGQTTFGIMFPIVQPSSPG